MGQAASICGEGASFRNSRSVTLQASANLTVPFSDISIDDIHGCPTLKECMKRAIETNDVGFVKDVVTGSFGELQDKSVWLRDAFIGAAQYGHTDLVDVLLDEGAHIMTVDQYGHSAFITAVKEGHVKFVEKLIILGFPVSNHRDGIEALYDACNKVRVNMLKLLLAHTNDEQVNAEIDIVGFTLLGWSIMMNKPRKKEIIILLLEAGANVNQITGGCTALHLAVGISDLKIVKMLLEANADANIKNKSGENAFWVANLHRLEILILLLQYGADPTPSESSYKKFFIRLRRNKPYVELHIHVRYSLTLKLLYSACPNKDLRSIENWLKTNCTIPEVLAVLDELTCTPRSLQSACRLAVRGAMNMKRPDDVKGLSLPLRLKEYLLFSDIQATLEQADSEDFSPYL